MFNLLPETEQKFVKSEYNQRRLALLLSFILMSLVIGGVFLAPALFVAHYRHSELAQTADILEHNIAVASKQSLASIIAVANKKISTLETEPSPEFSRVATSIGSLRTSDIKILSYEFKQLGATTSVAVRGRANSRESLLAFAKILQQDPAYENVNLPISNFAKEQNIEFTFTLTARQQ